MNSYILLELCYSLDPTTAPWPVALLILIAAILLALRLRRIVCGRPVKRRFHITRI
jgi:hypothetical protein